MSNIVKKFAFQILYAVSQLAFPLITYPYITRKLGAEGLGIIGYIEYVSGFIITLAAFGIPFFGVREIAKMQQQEEQKKALLRNLFSFHLLTSLIGCALFISLVQFNQQQNIPPELLVLGCINIILPAFIAEWYMQGIEAFVFTTVRSIILRFLGLVALFFLVNTQEDYVFYFFIIVLVQAAIAVSNMFKIGTHNFLPKLTKESFPVRSLWHFFLTSSIISVYVFFDVLVLGWVADEVNVGYYTVAIKIVKLSLLMVLSVNVILFPRISFLKASDEDDDQIRKLIHTAMQFILVATIPLAICFYLLAPEIVNLLAGDKFLPSVPLIKMLGILPLVIGFSNLFVYQILTPFGKEKQLLICVGITCVFSLTMHIIFTQLWLEQGSAIATIATELLMTILVGMVAAKTFHYTFPTSTAFQTCLASLPLVFIVVVCRNYVTSSLILILITGSLGMTAYILTQHFIFKNALFNIVWSYIKDLRIRRMENG